MRTIKSLLACRIGSEYVDARVGEVACFAVALLIGCAGIWQLTSIEATEIQLFLGLMLTVAVALLFIVLGMLVALTQAARSAKDGGGELTELGTAN